jgi:hydrogenase expression/formation protein HypC
MCLAIPAEILEIEDNDKATADFGGVRRKIITTLIEDIKVGDYVIVHTGYAISKLSKKEAVESLELWDEVFEIINKDLKK